MHDISIIINMLSDINSPAWRLIVAIIIKSESEDTSVLRHSPRRWSKTEDDTRCADILRRDLEQRETLTVPAL